MHVVQLLAACLARLFAGLPFGSAGRSASRLMLLAVLAAGGSSAFAATVYVNAAATGTNLGTSWTNAYTSLQTALAGRASGDQIWVAQGTYTPGTVATATFQLTAGVAMYGGFYGNETAVTQANRFSFPTILSGALGTATAYHVVTGATGASITGFTITGGNSAGASNTAGAGLFSLNSATLVSQCTFTNNKGGNGGALYIWNTTATAAALNDCYFIGNTASGYGGAAYFYTDVLPTGGIYNCVFANNTGSGFGGGLFLYTTPPATTFPLVANCTFYGNTAADGGGLFESTGATGTTAQITNCIFWSNTSSVGSPSIWTYGNVDSFTQTTTASYCLFQDSAIPTGIINGAGNLFDYNPDFANPSSPAVNGIYGTANDGLALTVGSPAVDSGTSTGAPSTDISGHGRPLGAGYDMGAFELGATIYVTPGGAGTGSGLSWANAKTLPNALATALNGEQIWVEQGTYTLAATTSTFQLVSGMAMYGGFNGTETALSQRNYFNNKTILNGNNVAYHVVTAADNATIDGFTIENGNATSSDGGGLLAEDCAPIVRHCTFLANTAEFGGGAYIYCTNTTTTPAVDDCMFYGNNATESAGGGLYFYSAANVNIPIAGIDNCVFANNSSYFYGGGLFNYSTASTLTTVVNCTFYGNVCANSPGGALAEYSSSAIPGQLTNNIFWNNSSPAAPISVNVYTCLPTASNCLFQEATLPAGIANGNGNLFDVNPNFSNTANIPGPDGIYGTADDGLSLTPGSPAIDSGTSTGAPTTDISGHGRPLGAGYDMGAYEYGATIFVTPSGSGNGRSWATATSLTSALASALNGNQIWVKEGTYSFPGTPTTSSTYQLVSGVALYGGFNGTETLLSQRNYFSNQTVLNGAISGGNVYHVVTAADNATIDGFTIENGIASSASTPFGGGLVAWYCAPAVRHCTFLNNSALDGGAVMMYSTGTVMPALDECYFANNTATYGGGAMYFYCAVPPAIGIANCVFANNTVGNGTTTGSGGALILGSSTTNPLLVNCTFYGNSSPGPSASAGAVYEFGSTTAQISNCIFWNNTATVAPISVVASGVVITANNNLFQESSLPSSITGAATAANIFDQNPDFANTANLAGTDGAYGSADDGLALVAGSPALGSGTSVGAPLTDISGYGRPMGLGYDMGAYELPGITYVTTSGAGTLSGVSWANATTLHQALASAVNGSQIWVEQGTYATLSQTDTFLLPAGVAMYGGFVGTETATSQRTRLRTPTILNGNYGSGNSYHVVTAGDGSLIDGFTIENGNASVVTPGPNSYGGGLYASNATVNVNGCTFKNNSAALAGGGAYLVASSSFINPVVFDCYFYNNTVTSATSTSGGGGMLISSNNASIASGFAGRITNCVFADNTSNAVGSYGGAGLDCYAFGNGTIMNCTFFNNNTTGPGGGILFQNGAAGNTLSIVNSIFWSNSAVTGTDAAGTVANSGTQTATYTSFGTMTLNAAFNQTTTTGDLIATNPGFSSNLTTLAALAGTDGFLGTDDDGPALASGSPCINTGTATGAPATDISGHGRPQGGGYDMGAYQLSATIYVTPTAGSGNGFTWGSPMSLSTALNTAVNGNNIWVMGGTYNFLAGSSVSSTFQMPVGVNIYGGFQGPTYPGGGETSLSQRNVALNQTTLSGSITGGGSVYHVVTGANYSRLDGFVITGGNAVGSDPDWGGGGLLCNGTSPTVWGCVFWGNSAQYGGGASYITNVASPSFKNCVFTGNTTPSNGGAIECEVNSDPAFVNCTFSGNTSTGNRGGALETYSNGNCTFLNCVLWGDTGGEIFINGSTPSASFCDISGGLPSGTTDGGGNISTDPQFTNPTHPAGENATYMNGDDGLMLSGTSPALNKGSNQGANPDIIAATRPLELGGTLFDLGAYETPYVTVTANISTVAKPASNGTPTSSGQFTITRNGDTTLPMTLSVSISGTAVAGTDYNIAPDIITNTLYVIPAGSTSLAVDVNVIPTYQAGNPLNVVLTVNPSVPGSPNAYACYAANSATVTITNLNTAGVVILPQGPYTPSLQPNILFTNQGGTNATFTVQLNSQPTSNVTINLASSNVAEGTISPSTITFTPTLNQAVSGTTSGWNVAQTITVSGVNDFTAHGPLAYDILTSGAISLDPFYSRNITDLPSTPTSIYATSMPYVAQSGNNWIVKVTTSGTTTTLTPGTGFTVAASAQNTATITLLNSPFPTSGSSVQIEYVAEETFTATSGQTQFTTTFPAVLAQPSLPNPTAWVVSYKGSVISTNAYTVANVGGVGVVTLTAIVPSAGDTVLVQSDIATCVNNDTRTQGVLISAGPYDVTEGGASTSYTVQLKSQPVGGNVVINLASSLPNLFTNVSALTFTPTTNQAVSGTTSGWNVAQTVTVNATQDFIIESTNPYTGHITQTIAAAGTDYAGLIIPPATPNPVPITITDVDVASVVFTPVSGLQTSSAPTTATFSVQLSSIPQAPVTISLSSSLPTTGGAITIPASGQLTFGVGTWNVPQTVTVSGGSASTLYYIQLAAIGTGTTDTNYKLVPANNQAVSITNTAVGIPGVIISETGQLNVTKGGAGQQFKAQLATDPTQGNSMLGNYTPGGAVGDSVVVTFASANGLVTVSPTTATFTGQAPFLWSTAVPFTVTAVVNNVVKAQSETDTIIYTVISNSGNAYNGLSGSIPVIVQDNGVAGLTITPTAGLVTTESGGSANFQVGLQSRPADGNGVTVTLTSSNLGAGILAQQFYSTGTATAGSTSTVTFPGADDLSAVTLGTLVQVSGLGPNNGAITQVSAAVTGSSVTVSPPLIANTSVETYSFLPSVGIALGATTGNQVITFPAGTNLSQIFEGQAVLVTGLPGSATYSSTVRYVDQVAKTVTVAGSVPSSGAGTVTVYFSAGPLVLTWTSAGWQTLQTATVIGVHNLQVNGDVNYAVVASAVSGDPHYNTSASDHASTTIFDFPIAYVATSGSNWAVAVGGVLQTSGYTISNNGGDAEVTFTAAPSGSVTLTYQPEVFTSIQTTTTTTTLDFPLAYVASSGSNWAVTVGGVQLPPTAYAISNSSGTAEVTFTAAQSGTIVLTYQPAAISATETTAFTDFDYPIPYVPSNGSNWTVTEGSTTLTGYTITNNAGYAHVHFPGAVTLGDITLTYLPSVSLTNLNIDTAGFIVTQPTNSTIYPAPGSPSTSTFTIRLTSEPVGPVTIQVQSSNTGKGTVSPETLTFTQATPNGGLGWDQPQTVTVTAVGSQIADGAVSYTISMLPATSSDPNYNTLVAPGVTLTTVDPNAAGITVTPTSSQNSATTTLVTNAQSNTTASFSVVLTSQPLSTVTIPLSSSNTAKGVPSVSSLIFTPSNWNAPQTVIVTGVANQIVQGTVPYQIVFAQPQTSDPSYAVLSTLPVNINGKDNNAAGYVFSDPLSQTGHVFSFAPVGSDASLLTTDLGGTGEFSVSLTSQPSGTGTVTISLASTNTLLGTPQPSSLVFNATNWNQPQLVVVTGGNANSTDADGTYLIQFSSVIGPVEYNNLLTTTAYPSGVPFLNVAQNKTPTLSPITNVTVNETNVALASQPLQQVPLTGITTGQAAELNVLSVTAVSDNPNVIPNPTVTYNPTSIASPPNVPPATGTLNFQQGFQQDGVANITVTVTSVDTSTPPPPYNTPPSPPLFPIPNPWRGGTKTATQIFSITVNFVNQQPSFTGGPAQTLNEEVGTGVVQQVVPNWATAIYAGAANQSNQQLTFVCTNDDNALFSTQPAIDATGTLTYTLAPTAFNVTGANVTAVLINSGGTANGGINSSAPYVFKIIVNPVNQPPTLTVGPNIAVEEGAPAQTFTAWATGITAGPPDQAGETLTIAVVNDNNGLFTAGGQPAIDLQGNLTFTPNPEIANTAAPARGFTTVTLTVTNSGGTAISPNPTFTITINPTNAAPVVTSTGMTVPIGGTQAITAAMLSSTDIDSTIRYPAADPNLIFTVQLVPGNGALLLNGVPLAVGGIFHQSDIGVGLSYTHNGGTSVSDGFAFTVTDEEILEGTVPDNLVGPVLHSPDLPSISTPGTDASGNLPAATSPLQVFTITINRAYPVVALLPVGPLPFLDHGPATSPITSPMDFAAQATVTDGGSLISGDPIFTGGTIIASFVLGDTSSDVIGIDTSGSWSVVGSNVLFGGVQFGTLSITLDASGGTILTVASLSDIADAPTVQAFIRSLTYQNVAVSPSNPYSDTVTNRIVQVQVTDGNTDSNASTIQSAQLTIAVTSVPHTPVFTSPAQYITAENVPISGQAVAVDYDVGQTLTYSITGIPTLGTVGINGATGAFTFTPVANITGTGSFTVQVNDGHSETVTQVVSVIITAESVIEPFITSNPPMDTQQNDTVVYNVVGYSPGTLTPTFTVIGLDPSLYTISVSGKTATLTLLPAATANAGYVTFGILITDTTNSLSGFQPVTLLVEPTPAAGG